jgi:predicted nuclease of predicted toxin-antitoxin system
MNFTSLKILTDENISPKIVAFLRDEHFDVLDTKEQNWYGQDDSFILDQSINEKRFVLTFDSDFGTLAIHEQKRFYGIIYLRLMRPTGSNTIAVLKQLINLNPEVRPNQVIVISEKKIRIRYVE